MLTLLNSKEMKTADKYTIDHFGVDGLVLMERAALSVADYIEKNHIDTSKVSVVCGTGNNGGDGFAIARILFLKGINVTVLTIGDKTNYTVAAKKQYDTCVTYGINITSCVEDINDSTLIIDAIFGIGLSRGVEGIFATVINYVNTLKAFKISVDIPSGLSADTGLVLNTCVKADATITFAFGKVGLYICEGPVVSGDIQIVDIGISKESINDKVYTYSLMSEDLGLVKHRNLDAHKNSAGRVLVIAGSKNMIGACIFAARSAYRIGAGIVTVLTDESIINTVASNVPEAIFKSYNNIDENDIKELISKVDSILIGPGLSQNEESSRLLKKVIEYADSPVVIDADGLNILANDLSILKTCVSEVILTPHIGEMSRLINESTLYVNEHIQKVCEEFSNEHSCITVLKSHRSVVHIPFKETYINTVTDRCLATAGSGDCLAGIIAALISIGISVDLCAPLGCLIHGMCGVKLSEKIGHQGVLASDIIEVIPQIIK